MLKVLATNLLILTLTKIWQLMHAVPLIMTPWGFSLKQKSDSFQQLRWILNSFFQAFFIILEQDLEGRGIRCWKFWQLSYWFSLWQKDDNWCMPYPWSSLPQVSAWNPNEVPFQDSVELKKLLSNYLIIQKNI